jgi:hypothetical protein
MADRPEFGSDQRGPYRYLGIELQRHPCPGSGFSRADYNDAGLTEVSFNTELVYEATEQDTIH